MKAITFNSQNSFKAKQLLTAGVLALTGLMASSTASAGLVTGTASFTIDNTAVSTSTAGVFHFDRHWGAVDNALEINASTLGGTSGVTAYSNTDVLTFSAPVNTNVADIDHSNAVPEVIRSTQGTTMDTSDLSTGSIGLSGALRLNGPSGILTPFDFDLYKSGVDWVIGSNGAGFPPANVFSLVNVVETLNVNNELELSGDLKWSGAGLSYAGAFGFDTNTVIGSFSLAPSAVPVPAAVWMFGSGLLGLVAARRKKA